MNPERGRESPGVRVDDGAGEGPNPRQVGIAETLRFLRQFPVGETPRVLEVGCGSGELAVQLGVCGWRVKGIDLDATAVAAARRRGVDAVQADLLTFQSAPFEVVLVTHSLHHISPLSAAVERLVGLVAPGGWLLVEEFDHSALDPATARWFYDRRELLSEAGVLKEDGPRLPLFHDPSGGEEPHRHPGQGRHGGGGHHAHGDHGQHGGAEHHAHGTHGQHHTGPQMQDALAARLPLQLAERAPYLYRYLSAELEPTIRGERLARLALEQERRAVESGQLQQLGLRLAARAPLVP